MRKTRVMHLIHRLNAGGAENGVINLANNIDINLFDFSICALVGNGALTHRLNKIRTTLFELNKGSGNDLHLPIRLFHLFNRWRPDIVHTHAWGTLCEGFLAAKAARILVLIHGEHGTIQKKKHNILVQRMVWHFVDRVLSVSYDHAHQLTKTIGFPLDRIHVLANGVDHERFDSKKGGQHVRKHLNLRQDDIVIGTVGRLVPVKNQQLLIHSFSRLCNKYPNIRLMVTGDGPLRESLEQVAGEIICPTRFRFLGRRSDVPEIMAAMDIFTLPSHSEGMSNTILEAMSSGLPVIATAIGGNPELVVHGETGQLIPVDNTHALTDAIAFLVENPAIRNRMGLAGRQRVEDRFSLQRMVANYQDLYHRCMLEKSIVRGL